MARYPLANMAFGLLLSLTRPAFCFSLVPGWPEVRLPYRVMLGMALLTMIGAGVYGPLRNLLQRALLDAIARSRQGCSGAKWSSARSVQRGEWIAYCSRITPD